ncbi:hypothetical protein F5B22DRAFT_55578 [Xylaria bambusicola]|uniref:uncharacterized protein n=1 Tax=Xylaria bambusicola TaxID=326684 RepID=UPI002008095A|nr:uncharacterized protein F5B22DRAFT_55578 [Xylaria bambusicola]KAI0520894.1 hypothetical protein F5B22DRAFT_55578 [Xylaria bambusicola]
MPSSNINDVLATKPLTFSIKTGGGSWKCQIHSNRAAYEKTRSSAAPMTDVVPGISRSDSGLSTSSSSSAGSSSSH